MSVSINGSTLTFNDGSNLTSAYQNWQGPIAYGNIQSPPTNLSQFNNDPGFFNGNFNWNCVYGYQGYQSTNPFLMNQHSSSNCYGNANCGAWCNSIGAGTYRSGNSVAANLNLNNCTNCNCNCNCNC
jgi:hypothetical protein